MGIIQRKIPVNIVQLSYSAATTNIMNPTQAIVGRNSSFTNFYRLYMYFDLSDLPSDAIINSAQLCMYIDTSSFNSTNINTTLNFYKVTNAVNSNLRLMTWNTQPVVGVANLIESKLFYERSLLKLNLKAFTQNIVNGNSVNNGIIIINSEAAANLVSIFASALDTHQMQLEISYTSNELEKAFEKTININQLATQTITSSIEVDVFNNISVFVKNNGLNNINASIEISSNNIDFQNDGNNVEISPGNYKIIVPYYFSKYLRVKLESDIVGINSNIQILAR